LLIILAVVQIGLSISILHKTPTSPAEHYNSRQRTPAPTNAAQAAANASAPKINTVASVDMTKLNKGPSKNTQIVGKQTSQQRR
jgi:hypothetical protein